MAKKYKKGFTRMKKRKTISTVSFLGKPLSRKIEVVLPVWLREQGGIASVSFVPNANTFLVDGLYNPFGQSNQGFFSDEFRQASATYSFYQVSGVKMTYIRTLNSQVNLIYTADIGFDVLGYGNSADVLSTNVFNSDTAFRPMLINTNGPVSKYYALPNIVHSTGVYIAGKGQWNALYNTSNNNACFIVCGASGNLPDFVADNSVQAGTLRLTWYLKFGKPFRSRTP